MGENSALKQKWQNLQQELDLSMLRNVQNVASFHPKLKQLLLW